MKTDIANQQRRQGPGSKWDRRYSAQDRRKYTQGIDALAQVSITLKLTASSSVSLASPGLPLRDSKALHCPIFSSPKCKGLSYAPSTKTSERKRESCYEEKKAGLWLETASDPVT